MIQPPQARPPEYHRSSAPHETTTSRRQPAFDGIAAGTVHTTMNTLLLPHVCCLVCLVLLLPAPAYALPPTLPGGHVNTGPAHAASPTPTTPLPFRSAVHADSKSLADVIFSVAAVVGACLIPISVVSFFVTYNNAVAARQKKEVETRDLQRTRQRRVRRAAARERLLGGTFL